MSFEVLTYEKDGVIFEYQVLAEGASITGYQGMRSELHIPARIDDYPVTAIQKALLVQRWIGILLQMSTNIC